MKDLSFYNNFQVKYVSDEVHWYWDRVTSKIIAESGIPTDNHHMGKILLSVLKDNPERICQIDGATGQSYSNREVLEKSVRCASAFRNLGIQKGDVILILGPNHLDLTIPFYACFYIGAIVAGIDRTLRPNELSRIFSIAEPKIIFCQNEKSTEVQQALRDGKTDSRIVTFNKGENHLDFSGFLAKYGGQEPIDDFKATDFDPEQTTAYLLSTSGTTGLPKLAAITHKNLSIGGRLSWANYINFPTPTRLHINVSPLQWQSAALFHITSPIVGTPRLQTSGELTQEHFFYLLRTYKPTLFLTSPNLMTALMKPGEVDLKDLQCLENMYLGGCAVPNKLLEQLEDITPNTAVTIAYGSTELSTLAFHFVKSPLGSIGRPAGCFKYRLVNIETNEVIDEPNVAGELQMKGLSIFKGYYKNPEETAKAFTSDGWLKTGDVLYRDANDNYFFHERRKLQLKYMGYQISPTEVENVIRYHPGVHDVAVTGRPEPTVGDLPVACVVSRPGYEIKAEEILDLVKEHLAESKQLRGGVVFLKEMPLLPSGKIDRQKLNSLVSS